MKRILVLSFALLLLSSQCECITLGNVQRTQAPLSVIEKKNVTEKELVDAIGKLPLPAKESPRFWSRIANDPSYSILHRRYAVVELFRRHVHPGMPLSEFARVLDHPTWLKASDIVPVHAMGGVPPPVSSTMFEALFELVILDGKGRDENSSEPFWTIWLVVHGQVGDQEVQDRISGQSKKCSTGFIAQIGYAYAGLLPQYSSDRRMLSSMYSNRNSRTTANTSTSGLLGMIAKKNITENELVDAIGRLPLPAEESSRFWSSIANDPSYSILHRRYAVAELFRRHVHPGMRLSELACVLDHPNWLVAEDIWAMGSPYSSDTGFELLPLGALGLDARSSDTWHISLAAQGHVNAQDTRDLIMGRAQRRGIGNVVLDGIQWDCAGMLPAYSARN